MNFRTSEAVVAARLLLLTALVLFPARGFTPPHTPQRYAVVLDQSPLAAQIAPLSSGRAAFSTANALTRRQAIRDRQAKVAAALRKRQVPVTGSVDTLFNAVFVRIAPGRAAELKTLPGVAAVIPMPTLCRKLNRVTDLVNASPAWSAVGGMANAGAGIRIAILDSGIDETHAGFQDPSLQMPAGFPKAGGADDATHVTNKVIAVRSFVSQLAIGDGTPELTRPDDLSARDYSGHGTAAAMIAAGVSHASPIGVISGVAPKAWLGNYKIFGSPGVNDKTTADVVLQALEAAFNDGMDVALISAGDISAEWSPADQGAACGLPEGTACDPWVAAVANAVSRGMSVVAPAGNDGEHGPTTINSPGTAPMAITVGAIGNTHTVAASVIAADLDPAPARLGDGPRPAGPVTAPLFSVASVDATEHGCFGYPAGSLQGRIALLSSGQCSFFRKVANAQAAGAVAVLIFAEGDESALTAPAGVSNTGIPLASISAASAAMLKARLAATPDLSVTLDPEVRESGALSAAEITVAPFSSRGPNADLGIKPDLVAPGASIYTATQNYDPNGDLYNASGYVGVDGSSFAAALAAGAAALVKQAHPEYTAAQIRSALINSTAGGVMDRDSSGNAVPARVTAAGAGRLEVAAAVSSTLTVDPPSIAFGAGNAALTERRFTITNTGSTQASLRFTVQPQSSGGAAVTVSPASLQLGPGQSEAVSVALTGTTPTAGIYDGVISVDGGARPVRIPYLYLVGDGIPDRLVPLLGNDFVTESSTAVTLSFRVLDRHSVPVTGMPVRFAPPDRVHAATPETDRLGISEAIMLNAPAVGDQRFSADLRGNAGRIEFEGRTRDMPMIAPNGVVDGAAFVSREGYAPGSYITIMGMGLSETAQSASTPYLPLSLSGVSVSFDVPEANIHIPGRVAYVSGRQVNVQIPWELQGAGSALMKLTLSGSDTRSVRPDNPNLAGFQSQMVTIPLAAYAPSFFEYTEIGSGLRLAAALDESNSVVSSTVPAGRGRVVQFFLNGLGPVAPGMQPPSGEPAPMAVLVPTETPTITIGGRQAQVQFSGLAPGLVGLYQVNAVIPEGLAAGVQPVTLTIGGISSNESSLPVR